MTSVKWTELYESEGALIADMLKTKSNPKEVPYWRLVKGYEYIESFKRYYAKNGKLTDKQMVQLKRLAKNVHENVKY